MRGWTAVAWLAAVPAALTALWVCWRRRRFGDAWLVSPLGRRRLGDGFPSDWLRLLSALATGFTGGRVVAGTSTGAEHVLALVAVVIAATVMTLAAAGLLLGARDR
jgi:hypothetical protein